ncbi:glycosyltransferase family A protein [Algoriphagus hitonicola]|uniref:Glycosyltransferase involved in cell wall bisynthesis n=1 Tax=Algoriphagus hitonicola TaxID=435880 RepID=A0A1I2TGX4_9BACT|nr:glycosyltransferase family A protein [Algoriphagus hitonicola]SFG64148.1 Glycosyltransferase involved in cell wall bisynthesis [Algoriphagus hitonicola]
MFSIIIPLYNKAPYIQRAIDSVLNQRFKEFEIIVVNDGSTDGGENLVRENYGDQVNLLNQTNQGVSSARNKGITQAKFPWIAFLDADDYWHPDYLKLVAQTIHKNPNKGIIGCHYSSGALSIEPQLAYFCLDQYFKQAIYNTRFFTSATCLKKSFFEQKDGFDSNLKLGEDIDVWFRASLFFGDGMYIKNTLVYYGQEDDFAATKKHYAIEQTPILKLLEQNYYTNSKDQSDCTLDTFQVFQSKWVYFNLLLMYYLSENKSKIQIALKNIPIKYSLIHSVYSLPFPLLGKIFRSKVLVRLFRNYMKFCFRYIYT